MMKRLQSFLQLRSLQRRYLLQTFVGSFILLLDFRGAYRLRRFPDLPIISLFVLTPIPRGKPVLPLLSMLLLPMFPA